MAGLVRVAVTAGLILAAAACSGRDSGAAASCVAPSLTVKPASARVGDTVHVSGEWFGANCPDTVVNGKTEKQIPLKGLQLDMLQNQHTWTLARDVNAGGSHEGFDLAVGLPPGVRPGPAVIQIPGYGGIAQLIVLG